MYKVINCYNDELYIQIVTFKTSLIYLVWVSYRAVGLQPKWTDSLYSVIIFTKLQCISTLYYYSVVI